MTTVWIDTEGGLIRADTITHVELGRDGVRIWTHGEPAPYLAARRRTRDRRLPDDFAERLLPLLTGNLTGEDTGIADRSTVIVSAQHTAHSEDPETDKPQWQWQWVSRSPPGWRATNKPSGDQHR